LRVVLDTCILKLATFPADSNASALIYELARIGLIEAWVSPAILEEYADVLGDHPELVAEIVESFPVCYPLTELSVIRHELDCRLPSATRPFPSLRRYRPAGYRPRRAVCFPKSPLSYSFVHAMDGARRSGTTNQLCSSVRGCSDR
jgi:hypothetical protein